MSQEASPNDYMGSHWGNTMVILEDNGKEIAAYYLGFRVSPPGPARTNRVVEQTPKPEKDWSLSCSRVKSVYSAP